MLYRYLSHDFCLSIISIRLRVYGDVREEFERGTLSNYQGVSLDNRREQNKMKSALNRDFKGFFRFLFELVFHTF